MCTVCRPPFRHVASHRCGRFSTPRGTTAVHRPWRWQSHRCRSHRVRTTPHGHPAATHDKMTTVRTSAPPPCRLAHLQRPPRRVRRSTSTFTYPSSRCSSSQATSAHTFSSYAVSCSAVCRTPTTQRRVSVLRLPVALEAATQLLLLMAEM